MAEIIYNEGIQNVLPVRFLDYATAVVKDRAIPNGFDGLKPIHRRVLMAMGDLGLFSKSPYRKCAKTIGEVLGKYHPHGDQSAYEALVGLAQDFNMRYPLVDGSGNFGSVNDDPAAAMRYTEARLSPFGELMLADVAKLSPTKDNFDNSCQEPIVLSTYFPNILLNPISGIAVGLATKFAPHYAKDVYTALIKDINAEIKGKEFTDDDIIDIIKAPDFPTGAQIINGSEMRKMYKTGKGPVILRAKYRMEKNLIVYYEIPYKVAPKSILEDIAKLNLEDIKDVRDESSLMNGMRIVVELRKNAKPEYIVNRLFKDTRLQTNYSVNMVAVFGNRPKSDLSIKTIFDFYLDNLKNVHRKAKEIYRNELLAKLFVVNTMLKAIDFIDDIIYIVRHDDDPVASMQEKLGFTKEEAEYIYNIKISSLSKANKQDLDVKKANYTAEVNRLDILLADNALFLKDLAGKLTEVRDSKIFKNDFRRTEILDIKNITDFDAKQFIKKEPVIVSYSNMGMLKSSRPSEYKVTSRNCVGTKLKLREDEYIIQSLSLTTHDDILLISDLGRAYILPVYKLPIGGKNAPGRSVNNFLSLGDEEKIILLKPLVDEAQEESVIMVTKFGYIKRIRVSDLRRVNGAMLGTRAILLEETDRLVGADICKPGSDVAVFTDMGRGLVLNIDDESRPVRPTGKMARGVNCMRLLEGETIISACTLGDNSLLMISAFGFGKCITRENIKVKKRNQSPLKYMPDLEGTDRIAGVVVLDDNSNVLIMTAKGQSVLVRPEGFRVVSRSGKGVKMINIRDNDDFVVTMMAIAADDEDPEGDNKESDESLEHNSEGGLLDSNSGAENGADDTAENNGDGAVEQGLFGEGYDESAGNEAGSGDSGNGNGDGDGDSSADGETGDGEN